MKWSFAIRRKISAALLLSAIFVLIFVKNIVNRYHVNSLGTSFSSVYEDRLMVESYIYELSEHLFRKKIMLDSSDSQAAVEKVAPLLSVHDAAIAHIIRAYEETKLTEAEARYFASFKPDIATLSDLQVHYLQMVTNAEDADTTRTRIDEVFNSASVNLGHLSSVQISEGKLLNDKSQKIVAGSSLLMQLEMGLLIAIGLMILVLVFESTSGLIKRGTKQSLN